MNPPPDLSLLTPPSLPRFEVGIDAPDISDWMAGNIGLPGFSSYRGPEPGPHVALLAVTHGNEIAGAVLLDKLLRQGIRPLRGTLTLGFGNLDAYARFDPAQPTASRFVDEDLNRVWGLDMLDGNRENSELRRAREIRPLIDQIDILLDLHSMLWPSAPLMLSGTAGKGLDLARRIGVPELVVADAGHVAGLRLRDYGAFSDPSMPQVSNLIEAGQHWTTATVELMERAALTLLHNIGMIATAPSPIQAGPQRVAEVTHTITANTSGFVFVQEFHGGDVITRRNTLIALDGTNEIRTPHDNCLLVMPSLRPSRGHTAVRLARFL
jgi:predicted deacylase